MVQSTDLVSPATGLFLGPAPCVSEYDAAVGTDLFLGPVSEYDLGPAPCISDYDDVSSWDWSVSGPSTPCFRVRCWFLFGLVCFWAQQSVF